VRRKYREWIEKNVDKNCLGQCSEITKKMEEEFPELIRVRGHFMCVHWGLRSHWWLIDPDGEIIDPTVVQFPTHQQGLMQDPPTAHYEPWDESREEPTGKYPNCGDYCYNGDYCCSEACDRAYCAYLNNPESNW